MRLVLALLALLAPAAASAEDCTYGDLRGQFDVVVPCALLQDSSGIGQIMKRIWLTNATGELQIIEVPEPFRAAPVDEVMATLGRDWGSQRTPEKMSTVTLGGLQASTVVERKLRTTSRLYVFTLDGVNVIARLVTSGKRKEREEHLATLSQAFVAGFRPK